MANTMRHINIIGHQNPDTDSICSALAYAWLKNRGSLTGLYEARRAGHVNRETKFVLQHFGVEPPRLCTDVSPQIKDIDIRKQAGIDGEMSLRAAWNLMRDVEIDTLCIVDDENELQGLITIKDIARELGVSPSTVSRALKDNPDISQETRDAIHKYAREHNYKPNVLALNLRTSRSNTIGVIIPQLVHHFFSCVLSGIERTAAEAGYNILVAQSNEEYEREVKIVHSFLAARVCGVITSLAKDTSRYDHYQELLDNNIPIVFYDRICTGINTERVVVDDYAGSFAAVEYMIQTGCKRIFFYSAAPHLEISKNRRNGYMDAMKKYRIPVDQSMIKLCDSREKRLPSPPLCSKGRIIRTASSPSMTKQLRASSTRAN